jgi:RNA polymerase sigma factor (sigma-70 family)
MEARMLAPAQSRTLRVPVPLSVVSDERLARMVGQGDERAFGALYSRFHQPLYRYCQSLVRHEADAQDALQSTFTSALSALRRGQRDAPLRPWLFRIAHNESISLLRRRRPTAEVPETLESPAPSVEAAAEERARLAMLVTDMQALPERQRGALVMRELSGLSHEEVAQALGISVGAAKQTVFEARQALAEFAEGRAMPCEEIQRVISDGDRRALRGRRVRAHVRECSRCRVFAQAIPERRNALLALSPALPAAAASGLFGRITGATGAHHGSSGGLLATAGSKSLGVALSAKTVATGIAVVATATVGTVGAIEVANHAGHHPAVPARLVGSGARNDQAADHGVSRASAGGRSGSGAAATGSSRAAGARGHHSAGHAAGIQHSASSGAAASNLKHTRSTSGTATSTGSTSHGSSGGSSNAGGGSTNAHGGNPNAGGGSTNAHGGNPNAGGGSTNAHGGNPNGGGGSTNAHGGNPNGGGGSTNAHGGNPNAGGGNSTGTGSTNAHGGNPNAGGGNSHGSGTTTISTGSSGSSNAHGSNPKSHGGH